MRCAPGSLEAIEAMRGAAVRRQKPALKLPPKTRSTHVALAKSQAGNRQQAGSRDAGLPETMK